MKNLTPDIAVDLTPDAAVDLTPVVSQLSSRTWTGCRRRDLRVWQEFFPR
jgi:hypothetical protein